MLKPSVSRRTKRLCFRKCYVGAMPLTKTKYSELAQLAEHLTVNQVVAGSSPAFGAIKKRHEHRVFFFLLQCGRLTKRICYANAGTHKCPPPSHSRLTSLRNTQLVTLLAFGGFTRKKQLLIVFYFATQHSEP